MLPVLGLIKYFADRQKLGLKDSNLPAIFFGGFTRRIFGGRFVPLQQD